MISKLTKYIENLRFGKFGRTPLEPPIKAYIIRPRDGIQYGYALPTSDPAAGDIAWTRHETLEGTIYVAVCDFCGGNCGQCGTSVGQGIPFDFDLMAKNGKWTEPGWGFHKRT